MHRTKGQQFYNNIIIVYIIMPKLNVNYYEQDNWMSDECGMYSRGGKEVNEKHGCKTLTQAIPPLHPSPQVNVTGSHGGRERVKGGG